MSRARLLLAGAAAALATGLVGSIVQTQVHLAAFAALGVPIPLLARLTVTAEDIARFGPVMAAIAAAALVPAFLAVHLLRRPLARLPRPLVLAAAGAIGVWAAFMLMPLVTPMPALVMASRGVGGMALLSAAGAVGGLVFAWAGSWRGARPGLVAAGLLAVPAVAFALMLPPADPPVARADPAGYRVEVVARGLERPWAIGFLPDGRRLVTEMGGRLLAFAPDGRRSEIALDALPPFRRGGENGLLDLAVDPAFARNGLVYLTMVQGRPGASAVRAMRARLAGGRLVEPRILFDATPTSSGSNNGGRLAILRDGTLAMTVGDGNDRREDAQRGGNTLGKVVRFDRDGGIPRDNPFVGRPGFDPAIYSLGHRNPQGIAVDPANGGLLSTEHGARGGDEVNRIRRGGNYGWPVATGGIDYSFARVSPFRRLAGTEPPLLEWTPSIAPAGLAVYEGTLFAGWRGDLLVPALKARAVYRLIRRDGRIVGQQTLLAERGQRIRDVRPAPDGSVYVLTDGADAELLRLTPARRPAASDRKPADAG